jgi:hypothetical protein
VDIFVARKSKTLQSLYDGKMSKKQFVLKAGMYGDNFANVEAFRTPLSFKNAQRLAGASGQSVGDLWKSHMIEDLKHQIEEGTWIDVFKRIASYADGLTKPECPLPVEEKRAVLATFRDIVSMDVPGIPVPTEEDTEAIKQSDRDFYGRQRVQKEIDRDSLGRNRPGQNLERDGSGRRIKE